MARIPDDELNRIKQEISLQRLAEARGVELKRAGKELRGRCPFHGPDENPSFSIDPRRNVFHCFGCDAKGSVVDFVMLAEGVSFRHAVEILRADYQGISDTNQDRLPPKKGTALRLPQLAEVEEVSDAELRSLVTTYYHETLKQSPEALEYLEKRGLKSAEMIDRFKLGFSNRTLGYHLPQRNRRNGKALRDRLEKLGIIKNTGHELLRGSLTIPIFNNGQVVQLYGRKIRDDLRKGTPTHLYLPGPRRGIFNLEALAASKEIILCEALIDALTFWVNGFRNVTTSYGVNGFTEEMLEAFKAYCAERVLIAYDRDDGGEKAAAQLAEKLIAEDIECFRIQLPHGMDVNQFALMVTPAPKSLETVIRSATWLGKGKGSSRPTSRAATSNAAPPTKEPMKSRVITEPKPASPLVADPEPPTSPETQEIPASPAPPSPRRLDIPTEVTQNEVFLTLGDRRYRVRGLAKNMAYDVLKINLLVSSGEHFHVDTLNLYSARQRGIFAAQAANELAVKEEVVKKDLGKVLMKLEELQDEQIRRALEPKDTTVHLNDKEKAEAFAFLQDPKLLRRISNDFETCGLVGEHTNKLVGYLAAVSRKLDKPLAALVQSSSAAGKSALMEAVLAFMPAEDRVQYSAMTGQSLFYMGETDLKHKILAIAEEEGAERASYPLKLLQSEGELTIASTGKDPSSGRLVTHEYHVEGPSAILLTTTAIDLDEELQNRCIVLAVDESREQTEAIHRLQRLSRTREGAIRRKRKPKILALHRNAQRLLRPLEIRNPFAGDLTFLSKTTRSRRDQEKYLSLIDTVALLHQYQREVRTDVVDGEREEYIEVTLDDIAVANRLASEALGRTLDELPPQTRRLLFLVHQMVQSECERRKIEQKAYRFTRRDIREHTSWGNTQLKLHLHRLEEMEYLLIHRGGRGQSFVYELLYDGEGKNGTPFVLGLINVDKLQTCVYDSNRSGFGDKKSGATAEKSGSSRPQVGLKSGGGRGKVTAQEEEDIPDFEGVPPKNAHQAPLQKQPSCSYGRGRTAAMSAKARGE